MGVCGAGVIIIENCILKAVFMDLFMFDGE
jgi:hypothetical protein